MAYSDDSYNNSFTYNQAPAYHSYKGNNHIDRDMSLNGVGIVKAIPDMAYVTIGVITENKELTFAQQNNAKITQNVINSLINSGVSKKDIMTESYSVTLQYEYREGEQVFKGYRVSNYFKIRINNIQEIGKLVDTAVENGANAVKNINFTLSNPTNIYRTALSKAIIDAVNKALSTERALNITVDKTPKKIIEDNTDRSFMVARDAIASPMASTPIVEGEIEVVAKIKAIFNYT